MSIFTPYCDPSNPALEQYNMTEEFLNQGPEMIQQQQATLHPQQFNAAYSLPTPSGPQGPPQVLNQPQLSQVISWNDQGPAELSGPLQHQGGREAEFIPSTQVLESSMAERAQPWDKGQINQAQLMPSVIHPHQSNQDSSAIASRPQEVEGQHQQTTHVQIVPNVVANSMVQAPSMLPRFPPAQLEELTAGANTTQTEGNSQVSSKRQRISTNSDDQEAFVPYKSREVINGCYNPIYIEMGLPLDPHLRLLEASLKKEFPHE